MRALTNGRGADYVFVTVGSTKAIEQGLGLLRKIGTLVIVGMPPEGAKAAFEALDFADQSQRILGSKMGNTRLRVDIPKLVDLSQQGRLKLDELVTKRYPRPDQRGHRLGQGDRSAQERHRLRPNQIRRLRRAELQPRIGSS